MPCVAACSRDCTTYRCTCDRQGSRAGEQQRDVVSLNKGHRAGATGTQGRQRCDSTQWLDDATCSSSVALTLRLSLLMGGVLRR